MPKYRVVDGHKKWKGKVYAPGDVMDVSEDMAARLRLEPIAEEKAKKDPDEKGKK